MSKSKTQKITTVEAVQGANLASGAPDTITETAVKQIEYKYDELLETHKNKSAMIRHLASENFSRSQIAKFMGIKYQFVRNVLVTKIGKSA